MSKKKIKKCSYYAGESWKTKKRQKKDIDKKKKTEAFEKIAKEMGWRQEENYVSDHNSAE